MTGFDRRPCRRFGLASLFGVLLFVLMAAPAAADPGADFVRRTGNGLTLQFKADRSTNTIDVTLAGGATINGQVTVRGGGGSCNPTGASSFHCAFSPAVAAAAQVLVDFATTQRMPANGGGQVRICETPCNNSSHVHGPFVIKGPADAGPDLSVDIDGPTTGMAGQEFIYTATVTNVGFAESQGRKLTLMTPGRTDADVETRFTFQKGEGVSGVGCITNVKSCGVDVAALAPGSKASFSVRAESPDARFDFVFSPLEVLRIGGTGARTLIAELDVGDGGVGPDRDEHVTTFTSGHPKNDSNIRRPSAPAARSPGRRAAMWPRSRWPWYGSREGRERHAPAAPGSHRAG